MGEAKQVHLNGAYHGPPIPPTQSYHSHGRGRGCGSCFPCCLISFIFKIIFTIVIVVGIAALVFWLIFRPNKVKFHVVDASLTQFNLTNDNILHYNLTFDMTIRNPNKKIGIYYDRIEARAFYDDKRFDSDFLTPFYQGHKNTTTLRQVFQGTTLVPNALTEFNKDKGDESFNIEVKLYLKIRFKVGRVKTHKFKPKIKCDLNVPLAPSTSTRFNTEKCKIDF
ncbi:Late embryogenesis abundant protein [Macleaya cordata]|uniref:Late embryogenesis abundant protein n=1 Tax=Macleaya cordata TaxID=56857 RepID=A0A200Q9D8_MACCD|nr:Late embryogenesis abundant protein [Macleaya cordata]